MGKKKRLILNKLSLKKYHNHPIVRAKQNVTTPQFVEEVKQELSLSEVEKTTIEPVVAPAEEIIAPKEEVEVKKPVAKKPTKATVTKSK